MQMEITTEDQKACPIRVVSMELFAINRKEFGYREKIKKLEKVKADKLNKVTANTPPVESKTGEDLIKEEFMRSKGVPLVSWKEKIGFLKSNADGNSISLIETLDVISQYVSITQQFDRDVFIGLIEKLKELFVHCQEQRPVNKIVLASVKRCLRKILEAVKPNAA